MLARFKGLGVLVVVAMSLIAGPTFAQEVNINTADTDALKTLQHVGEARAAQIVKDREMNGAFRSIEDLARVPGIGDQIIESNRSRLTVGDVATRPKEPADQPVKSLTDRATKGVKDVTAGH